MTSKDNHDLNLKSKNTRKKKCIFKEKFCNRKIQTKFILIFTKEKKNSLSNFSKLMIFSHKQSVKHSE